MLDANENYFVSTYLTNFNYRHLMSKIKLINRPLQMWPIFLNGTPVESDSSPGEIRKLI